MIQSKLLESWSSLQANEKRVIQIILLAVPLIIISIYFVILLILKPNALMSQNMLYNFDNTSDFAF